MKPSGRAVLNVKSGEGNIGYIGEERKERKKAAKRRSRGQFDDGTFGDFYPWQEAKNKADRLDEFKQSVEANRLEMEDMKKRGMLKSEVARSKRQAAASR
eukprot:GHVH01003031.1.p2 GENE.GHVH01003031.1~~GHVH01003031.1.p2  ORF type:complete len:100 (+),score=19.76 GHVH01003031.1:793-1092(+)